MEPLTPEDLLIRQKPVDDERWAEGSDGSSAGPTPAVPLERFQTLEHVIRDSPINPDPYLELARIYLQASRWADARRILDLCVDKFPENEEANFLREEAQLNRSLQLLRAANEAHQAEPTRLTLEALDRSKLELNVLREKVCRSRLARHPEQKELHIPLAIALENLGKQSEAIASLDEAVAIPKLRASAAMQLGRLLERANRIPEALSAYRKAALFRVPPPSPELKIQALNAAADLAERAHMVDSARRYLEMLCELQPGNAALQKRLEVVRKRPL